MRNWAGVDSVNWWVDIMNRLSIHLRKPDWSVLFSFFRVDSSTHFEGAENRVDSCYYTSWQARVLLFIVYIYYYYILLQLFSTMKRRRHFNQVNRMYKNYIWYNFLLNTTHVDILWLVEETKSKSWVFEKYSRTWLRHVSRVWTKVVY